MCVVALLYISAPVRYMVGAAWLFVRTHDDSSPPPHITNVPKGGPMTEN